MAILTSHFLNGTNGTHAAAVGVKLIHIDSNGVRNKILTAKSDDSGRFSHEFDAFAGGTYELLIASGRYFESQILPKVGTQILEEIVIRFSVPETNARCHIPVIMSPNSYSCWWSS